LILIVPALRGFHVGLLLLKIKVFLRQGAKGPLEVPGIQLLLSPHHPQLLLLTHAGGFDDKTSQFTFKTPKLFDPS
jgi:hypothetical protein